MSTLYNISIWLFSLIMQISSLFNKKAHLWHKGRKNVFSKISASITTNHNIVWFHCASLGEFEQAKPILKRYKEKYPEHKITLTFFSPSGFEIEKNTKLADWVFYLPNDTKANAKKFINLIKPIKAVFIKYEFWFNYMSELNSQNIPLYNISTVFNQKQAFFKFNWFKKQLKNITHFFVQDKESANLLNSIGHKNYTISGDTRFDNVLNNRIISKKILLIDIFSKNKNTIICGSTWEKDELLLIKYIKAHPENNYIIAPHEMQNISILERNTNGLLYSNANEENILTSNVLIIDSIGLLSNIYQYGKAAYIGGGFGAGIHNILEATTFGLPIIFGPNHKKFKEANDLIKLKCAISISNYQELELAFSTLNKFDKTIAKNYIQDNCGATNIIMKSI